MSIASLRALYERRQTLHEHQALARSYLGLQHLYETRDEQLQQVLAAASLEAASSTPQEMVAIAGAYARLTNIVLAWNTSPWTASWLLQADGAGIEEDWLRRIGPSHIAHINFRGRFGFNVERYADVLVERAVGKWSAKRGQ